jgi:tubulin polyglutamylase complex subunit 2
VPSSKLSACPTANEPEVWFLDQSDDWHFLAATFTEYYRMMLLHLGLPFWQYGFTPQGLPREAKV